MKYNTWFWTECDELNKDTNFAHRLAEKAWNHQQAKIDHIREYLTSGMEVATENSEYCLALRDCLNELDGIQK